MVPAQKHAMSRILLNEVTCSNNTQHQKNSAQPGHDRERQCIIAGIKRTKRISIISRVVFDGCLEVLMSQKPLEWSICMFRSLTDPVD